jgi:nitrogen fixation NifU-like protein
LKFFIKLDKSKKIIEDIKFIGEGCAISISAASMLSEELIGKSLNEAKEMLTLEFIQELLGIEINPSRLKCALLCTEALKKIF